jgi:hypothetical protein
VKLGVRKCSYGEGSSVASLTLALMIRDEALQTVRGTLGQLIEEGEVPGKEEFEAIRRRYAEDAATDEDRTHFESLTWDEVHEDLWE